MIMKAVPTGIGAPVRRREDLRLLIGGGRYSDDVNLPGQAYAVMLRSPHAHALIRAIDTNAACAARGVLAVLTGVEMMADGLRSIPHAVWSDHPVGIRLANSDGSAAYIPPHFCMATDAARHIGEIVAVIVATSVTAAKDAAEHVVVDYQPLPAVTHALPPSSRARRAPGRSCVECLHRRPGRRRRATDAAFAGAAHIVRLDTWVQRVAGVPMEPRAAIGVYERQTGKYTLHAGAGGAIRPRNDLAVVLGVPRPTCAWSCTMSAAISARAARSIRNSRWWPGRRAGSAGR